MDADDLALFGLSLQHATESHSGPALDAALDELGWRDALVADPQAAVATLFPLQGAAGATSSALDQVVLAALGLPPDPSTGVILPALGRVDPPGDVVGEGLAVAGVALGGIAGLRQRSSVVVVAGSATVVVEATDLDLRPVHGMDPSLDLVAVTGHGVHASGRTTPSPAAWEDAVAAGQRAVAHELVGVSRTMLRQARDHAVDRIQFGQPIAMFQAVRHRLAEALVAVETADAALGAAWQDSSALTAALAKAVAGRSARTVARHCQQVLAGIGFTTEHPFHRSFRRAHVLDHLLGDTRSLTRRIGADLLAARALPDPLPL
jgi:alkylation response protein AidB-like acyl-CoA dehydrogenase